MERQLRIQGPHVVAIAIVLLGLSHSVWYRFFQPDDAFIYLVYIKSFLEGLGFTFNGELVEGFSSIVWPALLTPIVWLGVDPLFAAKLLGWMAYVTLGGVVGWLCFRTDKNGSYSYVLPLGVYFALPPLALWASGAMEAVLYGLILIAAASSYYHGRFVERNARWFIWSGIGFGLLSLTRPEGFAFIGSVVAFEIVLFLHGRGFGARNLLSTVVPYVAITGLMFVGRWEIYERLFPTTVAAKTGNLLLQLKSGEAYVESFVREYYFFCATYVFALLYVLWKRRKSRDRAYYLTWLATILASGYLAFNLLVGGDWMIGWRFMVPILPLMVLTIGLFFSCINPKIAFAVTVILIVTSGFSSVKLQNIAYRDSQATKGDILLGRYIQSLGLPRTEKVAVVDAGAIPYYTGLSAIDMVGLNDNHIASLPGGFMQKYDNMYVLAQKPEIIQFHTRYVDDQPIGPADDFIGTVALFYSKRFQRWYERDIDSPGQSLFRRRKNAIDHTFLDTFYDSSLEKRFVSPGILDISLRKRGDGVWLTQLSNHLEAGAVYLRIDALKNSGNLVAQRYIPIPTDMRKGDEASVELELKSLGAYDRVVICPTLLGIRDFDTCTESGGIQFGRDSVESIVPQGTVSYDDSRLTFTGWSMPEKGYVWSLGNNSEVALSLSHSVMGGHVSLHVGAFGRQPLTILVNGSMAFKGSIEGDAVLDIQADFKKGRNQIEFLHPGARAPSREDPRKLAVAFKQLIWHE